MKKRNLKKKLKNENLRQKSEIFNFHKILSQSNFQKSHKMSNFKIRRNELQKMDTQTESAKLINLYTKSF